MRIVVDNISNYSDNDFAYFLKLINKNRDDYIKKIVNDERKKESILAEKLLIDTLYNDFNFNYDELVFDKNEYGKPYIVNKKDVYFNMSHSKGNVAVTVSKLPVGIDIEAIRDLNLKTSKVFATEKELDYIMNSNEDRKIRMLSIFTLKESYFKLKGVDLTNLKGIEYTIDKDMVSCSDSNVISDLRINDNYVLAISEYKNNKD